MIPPATPTALPPATPMFDIPSSYSLWAGMPYAIQSWNLLGASTLIIKVIILIVIIVITLFIFTKFLSDLTGQDSKS